VTKTRWCPEIQVKDAVSYHRRYHLVRCCQKHTRVKESSFVYCTRNSSHACQGTATSMERIPVLRRGTLDPRPWSADEGEWTATRGSRVNGLHCTFKRPPLLRLSPFRVLHYPRVVLCHSPRLFSEMTNECPILHGSHPRPPCPLSAITPRSRVTHTLDSSNILLIFIFHKTN